MKKLIQQLLFAAILAFSFTGAFAQDTELSFSLIGEFHTGVFDEGAAEISAYDPASKQLFFTNADDNSVIVLDLSNPDSPTQVTTLDMDSYGDGVNSVAIYNGLVAVAVQADPKTDPGSIVFFRASDAQFISAATVGALPDMVTFTHDGSKVLVANEGEPSDDYADDPEGSVSILDVSGFDLDAGTGTAGITTADFTAYNGQEATLRADGIRIFGPGASAAQDFEPEYIAVSADDATAYVTLQENNAIAVVDIASSTVTDVWPLGYKDHSLTGNGLDASDDDEIINVRNYPVFGMYMPDAIDAVDIGGTTYLVTVNEGDAREYAYETEEENCPTGLMYEYDDDECIFIEEIRVEDLDLDPTIFTEEDLQTDAKMGRLQVTTSFADTNASGEWTKLYSFGARSFTIWNGTDGSLVYDSGQEFEGRLSVMMTENFNSDNTENDSFDSRSDAKGPEPEAVTIVEAAGKVYAFIGLERIGGVMVYDITDPANAQYVTYDNVRNFDELDFNEDVIEELDDLDDDAGIAAIMESVIASGPESITFLKQGASPVGHPLAVVSNEITGSITIHELNFDSEATPLFFSEYAEGSSNNKYLEIYNPTNADISLDGYAIASTGNDPSVPGNHEFWSTFEEGAVIEANSTYLWVNGSADQELLDIADETGSAFFNGNDAYALVYGTESNYEILDIVGSFLEADYWTVAGVASGTQEHTLVRKPEIMMGNPAPLGSFGTDADDSEWIVLDQDDFSNAGVRSMNNALTLTIFHNNDGESQLVDLGGDLTNYGGVARFKTLLENLRADAETNTDGSLFLSSGDNFLAGPEFNAGVTNGVYYDALAMSQLGYDAIALGNHDFDFGPVTTAEFISAFGADGPTFLSANLDFSNQPDLLALANDGTVASSTVLEVNGELVGVIGATTPNLPFISSPGEVIVNTNVLSIVQAEIDELEANGINKIILISHLQGIQEDSVLATQLSGIDVMIAGGGDELLANPEDELIPGDEEIIYAGYPITATNLDGDEVPIVTTRGSYSYVGKLVVEFDADGEVTLISDESGPVRVSGTGSDAVTADATLQSTVVDPVTTYLAELDLNILATTDVALDGVRNSVRGKETNLGDLIAEAYLAVAQDRAAEFGVKEADVALQNGGGIRNDFVIKADTNLTERLTFDILPFGNFLSVVEDIPPAQFKEVMENAVSKLNPDGSLGSDGTGRFAQAAGFYFVYDLNKQPREFTEEGDVTFGGDRIVDIVLEDGTWIIRDGEVVDEAPDVTMAIGNFNAGGGDQYPFGDLGYTQLGITDQQTLALFLTDEAYLNGEVTAEDYPVGGQGHLNRLGTPIAEISDKPEGVRVTVEGVVTRASGAIARVQDESGAIAVFSFGGAFRDSVESGHVQTGSLLRVSGFMDPFNGLEEIGGDLKFEVLSDGNPLPPAQVVTLAEIAANGEDYENELVLVKGISVDTEDTEFELGSDYTISDGSGESDVILRVQTSSTGESANFVGTPVPAEAFNYIGIVGQYQETYQLVPSVPSDIMTSFALTVLHNNDGESQLIALNSDPESELYDFGGVARFKTLVDQTRLENQAEGRAVLMLSSGDNFLAGPEYTVGEKDTVFYDALAIDAIGYDALSLGNHDFDFGPDITADFVDQINSIFLSANLDFSSNTELQALVNNNEIAKSTKFMVNGETIGVIGAITPNLPFISSPGNVVVMENVAALVQAEIDALEGEGVNKIILISHLQGIQEDSLLATELSGIDIMIAGGGDELLVSEGDLLIPGDESEVYGDYPIMVEAEDGTDVPIVTTKGSYSYLGQLVVEFNNAGELIAVSDESGVIRVAGGDNPDAVAADPVLQNLVVDPVAAGLAELAANVIATSEVTLDGRRSSIRAKETNQGNLIADAFLWQANQLNDQFGAPEAHIAIANGGGIRNDTEIPAGNITELTTFDMLPFLNFVSIVEGITPERFKLVMENAVSNIAVDGEGNPVAQGDGTGRYAQFAGFELDFDPSRQALELNSDGTVATEGDRVWSITLDDGTEIVRDGEPVDGAPDVNLATADFTARGGDQYPTGDLDLTLVGVTYQQALYNYITASADDGGLGGTITASQYPEGGEMRAEIITIDGTEPGDGIPRVYNLDQNYPNPFNPTTNIKFDLPETADVTLNVYNMLGQKVMTLVNGRMKAGFHRVTFDARSLASGMYIYRIRAGNFVSTKKMMLIK